MRSIHRQLQREKKTQATEVYASRFCWELYYNCINMAISAVEEFHLTFFFEAKVEGRGGGSFSFFCDTEVSSSVFHNNNQ